MRLGKILTLGLLFLPLTREPAQATLPQTPVHSAPDEKPAKKPAQFFTFDTKTYKLQLIDEALTDKYTDEFRNHLISLGADEKDLKDFNVSEFLKAQANSYNGMISSKEKSLKPPLDERESCGLLILQESVESIRENDLFVKFGHPLILVSNDRKDFDLSSVALIRYKQEDDDENEIEREAIYIKYSVIDPKNPDGERLERRGFIPADIKIIIIKGTEAILIDTENPVTKTGF